MRLKDVKFPTVDESRWGDFFLDLLEVEGGLVFGDAIGRVDRYPFKFEVVDPNPIK